MSGHWRAALTLSTMAHPDMGAPLNMTELSNFPKLPSRLGIAADLVFIVQSPMAFLADALLIYDQVVLPVDSLVLSSLYARLDPRQIERLLRAHRLVFCPGMSRMMKRDVEVLERSSFLTYMENNFHLFDKEDHRLALDHVNNYLLMGPKPDYTSWKPVATEAQEVFAQVARRPGYEFLHSFDPITGLPNLDRETGLDAGLARMNDLVAAGVQDMEMDAELPVLLDVCFPAKSARPISGSPEAQARETIEKLHTIKSLPPVGATVQAEQWSEEKVVDLLLSDDAAALRHWLSANLQPGLDVREVYIQRLEGLPSKKEWRTWLKFGTVNAVSTAIGLLATPLAGAAAALSLAAVDQKFGNRVLELQDDYHPKKWLALVERGYQA